VLAQGPRASVRGWTLVAGLALLAACASPVGVRRVDPITVQRGLTTSVLSSAWPSAPSLQLLQRLGLYNRFFETPEAVLAELRAGLPPTGDADRVFALAELSFFHAEDSGKKSYYLASAVYSYALLFPGDGPDQPLQHSDPRLRLAYDLYNRSLTEALEADDGEEVLLHAGRYELPWGSLDVALDPAELVWAGYDLKSFVPAADLEVHGLRNRYRWPGIGAPLVAGITRNEKARSAKAVIGQERIHVGLKVPLTAFLRLPQARAQLAETQLHGKLELYSLEKSTTVEIDGTAQPLELETSSSLAYTLDRSPLWDFELWGFLEGSFRPAQSERSSDGLFFLRPYQPGKIPVVLVHGTASSPGRWAEMVNELDNDPAIAGRYQFWLFRYNTGNPIPYSGALLRKALENTLHELDPEKKDAALRQMVVIGHSQGGLLTKLTAVDSGNRFWELVSDAPFAQVKADPETRDFIRQMTFFTPEPFVRRVIFISTPHRGSYLAGIGLVQSLTGWLVTLPTDFVGRTVDFVSQNKEAMTLRSIGRPVTSIDQMSPRNDFIQTLATIPVSPGIEANSIIAVQTEGPLEEANDGVVEYSSAHIEGVESELIVHSGHSTQGEPVTILEVRRILLEHLSGGRGLAAAE
jgi:pimeloyl-ACP methyl ester carboxylesterase